MVLNQIIGDPDVTLVGINDRFSKPVDGWADCAVYLTSKTNPAYRGIVAEIQIVHYNMLLARQNMGAHDQYDDNRFGHELFKKMENEAVVIS